MVTLSHLCSWNNLNLKPKHDSSSSPQPTSHMAGKSKVQMLQSLSSSSYCSVLEVKMVDFSFWKAHEAARLTSFDSLISSSEKTAAESTAEIHERTSQESCQWDKTAFKRWSGLFKISFTKQQQQTTGELQWYKCNDEHSWESDLEILMNSNTSSETRPQNETLPEPGPICDFST